MELENFLCKTLDMLSNSSKKYSEKIAKKLYYDVYAPIINILLPFLRSYDGGENPKFASALMKCKDILLKNYKIISPTLIKRIDQLVKSKEEFNTYISYSKRKQRKYEKSSDEKRKIKDKKYRKNIFEYFAHEILLDYNTLRKLLGIGKLTYPQKIFLDQVYFENTKSMATELCVVITLLFFIPFLLIVILIIISLINSLP